MKVYVVPHAMFMFHMMPETLLAQSTSQNNKNTKGYIYLGSPLEFIISNTTNEALPFHVFFYVPLYEEIYTKLTNSS